MKLLIVTQWVDETDTVLGFFCRWIDEFSKQCECVTVIGQGTGTYHFAPNVTVLSIGKEQGRSKLSQTLRFLRLIVSKRKNYDAVLVHMVPLWVCFGAIPWRILRKNIYLWYEARGARVWLKIATRIVDKVFSASSYGMPLKSPRSVITGHGIDLKRFSFGTGPRDDKHVISVGRLTQAKRLDVIVKVFRALSDDYRLSVIGSVMTASDQQLKTNLRKEVNDLVISNRIEFRQCTQGELIPVLQHAGFFLHASETSLDKALLEAMACGCIPVSSSEAAKAVLPEECLCTHETMTERVLSLAALSADRKEALQRELRGRIEKEHGLENLVQKLIEEIQS